jgi:acetyl esterase/lipase
MKRIRLFGVILLSSVLFSCQKEQSSEINGVAAATFLNISYGTDPLQNMDIYLPKGRSASLTKVIVMIHGGAWASGDKSELTPFVDTFKRRLSDYAIFNINYRISAAPLNVFPTQENDVKAAMEFISGKSMVYGISDKYALLGASAGGHLALLQGYKYSSPVKPRAIASLSGPTDLVDMYMNPVGGNPILSGLLASAIGKTLTQDPQLYANSSPITFITSSAPPTILLYGSDDPLVSPTQATSVKDKLIAANVTNQYVLYGGTGHVDTWDNIVLFDAFNRIQAFLIANVK